MTDRIPRGWALTAFLILAGVLSAFSIAVYSGILDSAATSQFSLFVRRVLLGVSTLRFLAIIAIWCWLKEGVVTYVVLTLVVIPLMVSLGFPSTAGSLIAVAVLISLVWGKWTSMRWLLAPANNRWRGP